MTWISWVSLASIVISIFTIVINLMTYRQMKKRAERKKHSIWDSNAE